THQQRKEYREAFLLYHDNLWETIHLRNDLSTYQERFVRRKIHAFNETAVREAILNAVSHREYRHQGSVFVRQWPRRIEITSPGGFPQGVTPETMLWKQSPRNRRIAESFARCGLVERAGQGANLIFETCIRESKLPPSFKGSDAFQVCMTLDGEVRDTLFVRFLNRAVAEAGRLDADDLLVLDHVHRGLEIPERAGERIVALCERDILEQDGDGFRLSHRMWDRAELNGASPEPRVLVWESPNGTNLDTAPATSGKGSGETWVRAGFLELLNVLETGLGESSLEPELATELLEDARKVRRQVEGDRPNGALVLGKVRTIVDVLGESTSGGELVLVARRLLDRGSELFGD
ncbi:MAG: hypothetical protein GY856_29360, partial [bacterium]|nr:hypothetical protein [bacterium]